LEELSLENKLVTLSLDSFETTQTVKAQVTERNILSESLVKPHKVHDPPTATLGSSTPIISHRSEEQKHGESFHDHVCTSYLDDDLADDSFANDFDDEDDFSGGFDDGYDSPRDYTACSSDDCGYCGKCDY
jgi:hypothetical protein